MPKPKLIIFDLDGTLVDAYPAIISSFNFTMQSLGYHKQNKIVICRAVGWGDKNLLKPFVKARDLNKAVKLYRSHHRKSLRVQTSLLPGASKVLNYLKGNGYKLAIASNRPTSFSWVLIRSLGLDKYFQYVLCADKIKYGKPHPSILKKILKDFSLRPEEAIYVGDMAIDAQAGRRAHVKTVIVTTGSSTKTEIYKERPFKIIGKLTYLLGMFSH